MNISIAALCAPVGVLLAWRKRALMADMLAHSLVPSMTMVTWCVGFLGLALPLWVHTLVGGVVCVGLTWVFSWLTWGHQRNTSSVLAGLSLTLVTLGGFMEKSTTSAGCSHILTGYLTHVTWQDTLVVCTVCAIALSIFLYRQHSFVAYFFDAKFFHMQQKSGRHTESLFMALTAIAVVMAMIPLGTLLALGLVLFPGLIMQGTPWRLEQQMWGATCLSLAVNLLSLELTYPSVHLTGYITLLILSGIFVMTLCCRRQSVGKNNALSS